MKQKSYVSLLNQHGNKNVGVNNEKHLNIIIYVTCMNYLQT